jgi:hypothetical protein
LLLLLNARYTVPKAMDDFIDNNEKEMHSFILWNEKFNSSFHRMNAFYISLLTMKSSIAFGTVHLPRGIEALSLELLQYLENLCM